MRNCSISSHCRAAIVDELCPGIEQWLFPADAIAREPLGGSLDQLEIGGGDLPHAFDFSEPRFGSPQDAGEGLEFRQQTLGESLGVTPRQDDVKHELEEFVVL